MHAYTCVCACAHEIVFHVQPLAFEAVVGRALQPFLHVSFFQLVISFVCASQGRTQTRILAISSTLTLPTICLSCQATIAFLLLFVLLAFLLLFGIA